MFDSPQSRYLLRSGVATLLAFLASLGVAITDDSITGSEWVTIALATVGALGAYLGVGAAVPAVEPFVGNRYEGADVPVPPAEPRPPTTLAH